MATDIEALTAQVAEQTASLESATAIRDKERAEFVADEKDMIQSITSLKGAVVVLSKAHGEGFLQVKSLLQHHAEKHKHLVMGGLSEKQRHIVLNLLQEHARAGTPASGEIFGVLKQMKESFETNLASSQKEETQAEAEYEQLKAAKTSEIAAAKQQIEQKTITKADADEAVAQDTQDKEDTEKAMAADTEFLADLKSKCSVADEEYAARVKVRTEEIQAVSDTMGILTNDEAQDTFTKSMSFIQRGATLKSVKKSSDTRAKAASVLKQASVKLR